MLGTTLTVNAHGYNRSIRCVPLIDTAKSSLTFYKYTDMRFGIADDMWLMGQNSWFNGGYSIGTPVLGMCFNIGVTGVVTAPYKLLTPIMQVDTIRGNGATQVTIDDDVIITGNLVLTGGLNYKPFWLAGKVNGNGVIQSSKWRYTYTCTRNSLGLFTIIPSVSSPFTDTYYIVNNSCQIEGANATSRIVSSSLSVSSFQIMTYVNNSLADCMVHFAVLN